MIDNISETWKPVAGYEGRYEVSDAGRLRKKTGQSIGLYRNDQGYVLARLSGPRRIVRVHRVVAEAFIPRSDGKTCVNHLDCNPANNTVSNLEWCTQGENIRYAASLGRMASPWKGKRSPSAKLSDSAVAAIRSEYAQGGVSWEALGRVHGISKRSIGRILSGEYYQPLPPPPTESKP